MPSRSKAAPADVERQLDRVARLVRARRTPEARRLCQDLLKIHGDRPRACHLMAVTDLFEGNHHDALQWLGRAIDGDPRNVAYHCDHGMALARLNRHAEAIDAFQRALDIRPDLLEVHFQAGQSLRALHREAEAMTAFRHIVRLRPDAFDAWMALAETSIGLKQFEDAVAACQSAVALRPQMAHGHYLLGIGLYNQNRTDDAVAAFDRAIALEPAHHPARFARCLARLQIVYADGAEIDRRRAEYAAALDELRSTYLSGSSSRMLAGALDAVGAMQPYYLPYQGENDRELQGRYGDLVVRIMAAAFPQWQDRPISPASRVDRRLRVGFVSGHFHTHSVWKMPVKGWLEGLDRGRFVTHGYYTQGYRDPATDEAAARFEHFVHGPRTVAEWAQLIRRDDPHVLIYPEIGMDPTVAALAALRLAPVQCSSWGHPETSGYPTVDYFLGSDLMEPADADTQYTETLVRLPNLSVAYEPVAVRLLATTRRDLGLGDHAVVFAAVQNLAKYLPAYDQVFPRIAREVENAQFLFVENASAIVTAAFQNRMQAAFADDGLEWQRHCVVVPRMSMDAFATALSLCDGFLDSIGWSGCNTTMEALNVGVPVIGYAGWSGRGRHTAAILNMIGMDDLVAHSVDDYVALAIRMAKDPQWRQDVAKRVIERRERAYRDPACIRGLEDFLENAVARSLRR